MSLTAATAETSPASSPAAWLPGGSSQLALLPLVATDLRYVAGGKTLIDGVSFTLQAGPKTIVLGPNGAGKSLLLRLCHGLISPTRGLIDWAGRSPEIARRHQAMVFQLPGLLGLSAAARIA